MNELAVIEVDELLKLVEAFRLTPSEIAKLNKAGHAPVDQEGYYNSALQVLQWRTETNPNAINQISALVVLAGYDGVALTPDEPETPTVNIPIFGIGLL